MLVANEEWYADHTGEAKKLLALWDRGLSNWADDKNQVIEDYPHLFSVNDEQEIDWIADYADEHAWYTSSSYITPTDVKIYEDAIKRMRKAGLLYTDTAEIPKMIVHHSESAESGELEKP